MKPSMIAVLAMATLLACACASHGEKLTSAGPTTRPTARPTATIQAPTAVPTPEPGLTFEVADFDDNLTVCLPAERVIGMPFEIGSTPAASCRSAPAREGWRRVAVELDIQYDGGLEGDTLTSGWVGRNAILVSLNAPNGATYRLDSGQAVMHLAPGVKIRRRFEGEVPAVLPTIEGSTVTVEVGDLMPSGSEYELETVYFGDTLPLAKGRPFVQGTASRAAPRFSTPIEVQGSFTVEFFGVEASTDWQGLDQTEIFYRLTNTSGYDVGAPFEGGTLVGPDGYAPSVKVIGCDDVPPGYTGECSLEVGGTLSQSAGFLLLLLLKEGGTLLVFHEPGQ